MGPLSNVVEIGEALDKKKKDDLKQGFPNFIVSQPL